MGETGRAYMKRREDSRKAGRTIEMNERRESNTKQKSEDLEG